MRPSYYAVIWGDEERDTDGEGVPVSGPSDNTNALRLSDKVMTPHEACRQCWGLTSKNMWVKDLGTSVTPLRTNWKRALLLSPMHGTWRRMHKEGDTLVLRSEKLEPLLWVDGKLLEEANEGNE